MYRRAGSSGVKIIVMKQLTIFICLTVFYVGCQCSESIGTMEEKIDQLVRAYIPMKDKNNQFIHFSLSTNRTTTIRLNSQHGHEPCVIQVSDEGHFTTLYKKMEILGNGKIIVMLMLDNTAPESLLENRFFPLAGWKGFIIELNNCSYESFEINERTYVHFIVPYEKTFDVVVRNWWKSKITKVYRFDEEGKVSESFSAPVLNGLILDHLSTVKPYDPSEGYYYVSKLPTGETLNFEKLDSKYKFVERFYVMDDSFLRSNVYSLEQGRFSACSYAISFREDKVMNCFIADKMFNSVVANATIRHESSFNGLKGMKNLSTGGVGVIYAQLKTPEQLVFYVLTIGENGAVGEPVQLGEYPNLLMPASSYPVYFFEMQDRSYCAAIATHETVMTKCIAL